MVPGRKHSSPISISRETCWRASFNKRWRTHRWVGLWGHRAPKHEDREGVGGVYWCGSWWVRSGQKADFPQHTTRLPVKNYNLHTRQTVVQLTCDSNRSPYERSWTQKIKFRYQQQCLYVLDTTYPLCVVANILLNHNIKNTIFVKVTKGGLTAWMRTQRRRLITTQSAWL